MSLVAAPVASPIFVVGCQRSGSTMLGAMLGAHPDILTIPEAQFVAELIPPEGSNARVELDGVIEQIAAHYRFKIWQFDLNGQRPGGSGTFADAIRWLVARYGAAHDRASARFWVDQQPGHIRYLARLKGVFPDLKVIHIVRDGRAVAASLMPLDWGPNTVNRAAYFWQQRLAWGLAAKEYLAPDQFCQIRYEDIVSDPAGAMQRLAAFIGVSYVPEMVEGRGLKVPAFTQGQHSLVGQAPQTARLASWRKQLSPREIEIFEAITGDLLDYLGYERVAGASPRPMGGMESVKIDIQNLYQKYLNILKFNKRVRDVTTH